MCDKSSGVRVSRDLWFFAGQFAVVGARLQKFQREIVAGLVDVTTKFKIQFLKLCAKGCAIFANV